MAILTLLLFMGLFVHDALVASPGPSALRDWLAAGHSDAALFGLVLAPKLLLAAVVWHACRKAARRLGQVGSSALRRLDFVQLISRQLLVASYLADLFILGALLRWRAILGGNLLLVDELLVMLPALALNAWMWWAYYPVDARLREASLMARIDQGLPLQVWTRGQYMLSQVRHQWALMGLPLLLLSGWWEAVRICFSGAAISNDLRAGLMLGGAMVVFLFTPPLMRYIWDTAPLPRGDLRDRLTAMCSQYRVRVRELLLWRTFGGMINGAVMGIIGPLRYILLTDALLETMPARQVEAVMAHELAHVRKKHIFWLLLVAASSMEVMRRAATWVLQSSLDALQGGGAWAWLPRSVTAALEHPDIAALAATVFSIVGWFFIFGWVSRRFERQADTFAVQHLARQWHEEQKPQASPVSADPAAPGAPDPALPDAQTLLQELEAGPDATRIPAAAAAVMASALQSVADLNCVPVARKSWRHGSIAWRQQYLRQLTGQPIEETSIDRQVNWIKVAGLFILAAALAMGYWEVG